MKKRSERKALFTSRAMAAASAGSAMRICEEFGNEGILHQAQPRVCLGAAVSALRPERSRLTLSKLSKAIPTNHPHTGLVGFAELTIGQIAEHDGVGGALELLLHFRGL